MTMRSGLKTTGLALALAVSACSPATEPDTNRYDTLVPNPQELTLSAGEEKQVGATVIRVSFGRVIEDSRCPTDGSVVCVWEGRARVELGIRAGMGPTHPIELGTEQASTSKVWNGLRLTLVEVAPAPRNPQPRESEYSIRVRVEADGK